jgi:beta-glucosidase
LPVLALVVAAIAAAAAWGSSASPGAATSQAPPPYRNAKLPVSQRVDDLLGRMTLAEKVGQMTQVDVRKLQGDPANDWDRGPLNDEMMRRVLLDAAVGSVLSGGGASPAVNTPKAWAEMTNAIQHVAVDQSRLGIPVIYGVDAVHGHNNVLGATLFPHQIGLGASFDPALAQRIGERTARAVRATGIHWDFAPVTDTARDLRWGRYYEPFGEDPLLTGTMAAQVVRGLQGEDLRKGVAATVKHFLGYSAPDSGHDRTDATISPEDLQDLHEPPFQRAIDAGAATVMVNSGSINGNPVHASHALLTDLLRNRMGFEGVTVSDWQDVENLMTKYHVAATYPEAVALAVNAGIDMAMVPMDAAGFTSALISDVEGGTVTEARIDEAVSRILALKFRLGLFERPYVDVEAANEIVTGAADHRLAKQSAAESLTLLENDGTLPLARTTPRVLVTGPSADSAVNQLGGWSIDWQGADVPGELPDVTTVKEGVEQVVSASTQVRFSPGVPADSGNLEAVRAARAAAVGDARRSDAVIVAVGEPPYAEGPGDTETAALPEAQRQLIDSLVATGTPTIVVVIAGRPLVMNHQLDEANASLMAFLPGTEGGSAIADALFGRGDPAGRLPVSWPQSIDQAPLFYNHRPGTPYEPRYAFGYGGGYSRFDLRDLRAPSEVGGDDHVELSVQVRNAGSRAGEDIVQAFVERIGGPATAPSRQLVAFDRLQLARAATTRATLSFDVSQLAVTQPGAADPAVVPGRYRLIVGDRSTSFTVTHGVEALSRSGWTASASSVPADPCCAGDLPANAIDGNPATRWSSGAAQAPGQSFTVDLGSAQAFDSLVLDAGSSSGDYPRRFAVYASDDPAVWGDPIATGAGSATTSATFPLTTARYVRIVQAGTAGSWWSIHELNLYR